MSWARLTCDSARFERLGLFIDARVANELSSNALTINELELDYLGLT